MFSTVKMNCWKQSGKNVAKIQETPISLKEEKA